MASDFIRQMAAARRAGAPLIAIRTPDPASTIREVIALTKQLCKLNSATIPPMLHWDIMNGLVGLNAEGDAAQVAVMPKDAQPSKVSGKPSEMLAFAQAIGTATRKGTNQPAFEDAMIFMANGQAYWEDPKVIQGIWNLRDINKAIGGMFVMLLTMGAVLPDELANDVVVIDEPLPDPKQIETIVRGLWKTAEIKTDITPEIVEKAIDASIGLPAFPIEQAVSMSLEPDGIDLIGLWDRKRQIIEQTPGLSVWRGGEKFDQIGGCDNIKEFLRRLFKGKNPPRVIAFIDEIEKQFAGTGSDSSGVKTEMTGTLLTWMQDKKARGCIFIGPPGAAKSVVAKAAGNEANVPTVYFDLAAMQDSKVGKSGERLRAALKTLDSISQGRAFFIATCNKIKVLPPELRRRFKRGTWFFPLPSEEERDAIWKIYEKRYSVNGDRPNDDEWTGAEIEQCCDQADEYNITLQEAAAYVVPVARADAFGIAELCEEASGKFIHAGQPGVYSFDPKAGKAMTVKTAIRKVRTGQINVTPEVGSA